MKTKTFFLCGTILGLFLLAGCSNTTSQGVANELEFSLSGISQVTISYDEEPITFFAGNSDELIIKEYMTDNNKRYYAKVEETSGSIKISEGNKPLFHGKFSRYVEVYLPVSYQENLTVTTTNGEIDLSDVPLELSSLRVDSTSGTIQIEDATAHNIHLSTTSGKLKLGSLQGTKIKLETTGGTLVCEKLDGNVTYTSTSGDAEIKSAIGSGSYRANNSGKMDVTYTEVTGDLSLFNKNDKANLTIPSTLDFDFEATTKNGSISTTFQQNVSVEGETVRGAVGENPDVTISVETKNGDIQVTQQ